MERRRSLAGMDPESRQATLMALVEPLTTLHALLKAACAAWADLPTDNLANVEQDHKARFLAKFNALYAAQRAGQRTAQETGAVR